MVEQIVAGDRVDEHHQVLPMDDASQGTSSPNTSGANASWQLQSGCGPTGPLMDPPHLQRKAPRRLFARGVGLADALRIEIDVSMEALDAGVEYSFIVTSSSAAGR